MPDKPIEASNATNEAGAQPEVRALVELFRQNGTPLKLVTGTQTSQGLTFKLQPGAIVAHPGSAVVFVCG